MYQNIFNWKMENMTVAQLNVSYPKLHWLQLIVYQLNFLKIGSTNRYPHLRDEERT